MHKSVTAKDVAKEAGVSQATVSYVINNQTHQRIRSETRKKVLNAAEKLGYRPSAAARALRTGKSTSVLLLVPDVPIGPAVAALIEYLTDELEAHGLTLITRRLKGGAFSSSVWQDIAPVAVASVAHISGKNASMLRESGVPLVSESLNPDSRGSAISNAQIVIGRLQVEHLAATGHTHIGYAAPDDVRVGSFLDRRLEGVRAECVDLGLAEPKVLPVPLNVQASMKAVARWRAEEPVVTAVCAYNDDTAFAVLAGLHALGLKAPDDLAVIGVDNIPLAPLAGPALTTIDQNVPKLARHIASQVVAEVRDGPDLEPFRADDIMLIVRDTA